MASGTDNRIKRKTVPAQLRSGLALPAGASVMRPGDATPGGSSGAGRVSLVGPEQLGDHVAGCFHGRAQPLDRD